MQVLQFLLCPPNPLLPIPVFQFPRDYFVFSPGKWGASLTILLNIVRQQANLFTLPDDPFDWQDYADSLNTSTWQVHVKCAPFITDSSLWALFASRMNSVDSVLAAPLDDGQLTLTYRRYFTAEGEQVTGLLNNNIANGALYLRSSTGPGSRTATEPIYQAVRSAA